MQSLEIQKYVDIAVRRKYWIIIPVLVSILCGIGYFLKAPRIYEAETTILVGQRFPKDFVRPLTDASLENRIRTISQEVTSRTNLEKIIGEGKLKEYKENSVDIEQAISALRNRIRIDVKGSRREMRENAFAIAFQDGDPEIAMRVTNDLASTFIAENAKTREEQATGASSFLSGELESMRKRLGEKESELKEYRERNMGGLPEQLQTNLATLERLEGKVKHLDNSLRDAENRRNTIQTQIAEGPKSLALVAPASSNLQPLRDELASLEVKYTNNHPDVIRLKERIANLERQGFDRGANADAGKQKSLNVGKESGKESSTQSAIDVTLKKQLQETQREMESLREEIRNTRSEIGIYRKKVEDTPRRELELVSLKRDYDNLKGNYDQLLKQKLEADIALSLEIKQKGEQFKVIDPARKPSRPIKPDMQRSLLITFLLGLGVGAGLAYFVEIMDSSYKNPEELEEELRIPVLMSIPVRHSAQEVKRHKKLEYLKAASVSFAFVVLAVGIVVTTKGVEKTLGYMNSLLSKI